MQVIRSIQNRIYEVRGERVMFDFDIARLYEVETRVLNQSVKRNIERFPDDFMFRLNILEFGQFRNEVAMLEEQNMLSQTVMTYSSKRPNSSPPFAFTEQGIAMLSSVLHSEKAIQMSIAIMRAFADIRKLALNEHDLRNQLKQVKERLGEHDVQLTDIYDAMENLLDEQAAARKWEHRVRIGFRR